MGAMLVLMMPQQVIGVLGIGSFIKTPQDTINTGYVENLGSWSAGKELHTYKYNNKVVEFSSGTLTLYMHCGFASNNHCDIDDDYTNAELGSHSISNIPYSPHTTPTIHVPRTRYIC